MNAKAETNEYRVGGFDRIKVSNSIKATVTLGKPTDKVVATGPEEYLKYLTVKVKNGTLTIGVDENAFRKIFGKKNFSGVSVSVSSPSLSSISASTSATVTAVGDLNVKGDLELGASTSGMVTIGNVNVGDDCKINTSTSGAVTIATMKIAEDCTINASTSSSVDIVNLRADDLNCSASTSSTILMKNIGVNEFRATGSTSGTIRAAGKAALANYNASTGGLLDLEKVVAADGSAKASTGGTVNSSISNFKSHKDFTGGRVKNK